MAMSRKSINALSNEFSNYLRDYHDSIYSNDDEIFGFYSNIRLRTACRDSQHDVFHQKVNESLELS